MSEFTSKDDPTFTDLDFSEAEPTPAENVILVLPDVPGPENIVPVGTDIQQGQSANVSPNKQNVLQYALFVQKGGSWTKFMAQSEAPINTSSVQDVGNNQVTISINGNPAEPSMGQPAQPPM